MSAVAAAYCLLQEAFEELRGTFAARGYKKPAGALADLLGWEWFEARLRVVATEQACERVGMDGTVLAARLPATGKAFAAGQAGLRHVEVIAGLLATPNVLPNRAGGCRMVIAARST